MNFREYKKGLKNEYNDTKISKSNKRKLGFGIAFASIILVIGLVFGIDAIIVSTFNSQYDDYHNRKMAAELVSVDKNDYQSIINNYTKYSKRKSYLMVNIINMFGSSFSYGNAIERPAIEEGTTTEAPEDSSFTTNTQTASVDEADISKCDGNYIYYLNESYLYIYNISTSNTYSYNLGCTSNELYLCDTKVIVIGQCNTFIFSKSDKEFSLSKQIDYSFYNDSRVKDNYLYLISGDGLSNIELDCYSDVFYDSISSPNLMYTVSRVDLTSFEVKEIGLLGSYSNILYASNDHFYFTNSYYNKSIISIFDYDLNATGLIEVEGFALNQFSLDEYNGYFRVATTMNKTVQINEAAYQRVVNNTLYVYSLETLELISSLNNIGKANQVIKSVRFSNDKCYIVTYENTDPLYEINLADPYNPFIASSYEAPGYSSYLHDFLINGKCYVLGLGYTDAVYSSMRDYKISIYESTDSGSRQIGSDFILSYINDKSDYTIANPYYSMLNSHKNYFIYNNDGLLYLGLKVEANKYVIFSIDVNNDTVTSIYKEITISPSIQYGSRAYLVDGMLYVTSGSNIIKERF